MLHRARISLQVDIGFGDVVTPAPERIEFPTLLDAPAPRLRAYSRYTMVAEKLEAMVRLGMANSRMKDFYDVWLLSRLFEFRGRTLCEAVRNTFSRRATPLPDGLPTALTEDFRQDPQKQTQWQAFVRKARPEPVGNSFGAVIYDVVAFLMPIVEAISSNWLLDKAWVPGGPWK
jgi:predicted nucleotidyltransferase component of viral defense system